MRRRRSSTEPVDGPADTREEGPGLLRDVGDSHPSRRRRRDARASVDELNEAVRQHEHLYEEHRHELEDLERSLIERQESMRAEREQLLQARSRLEERQSTLADRAAELDSRAESLGTREPSHPERIDEWRATLMYLRDFADQDGMLPQSFDGLLWDAFEPILELQGGHRS